MRLKAGLHAWLATRKGPERMGAAINTIGGHALNVDFRS